MASSSSRSRWSSLPPDILTSISKILNTDVDILRLRSVCSTWRSSLPTPLRPSPFPLRVPLLLNCLNHTYTRGGSYRLNYTTLYRLSPPEYGPCAGDSSDGWLFRVSELNPNSFVLLSPLVPGRAKYAPGSVPKLLNLLNYRITEIRKCYHLTFVDDAGFLTDLLEPKVEKIAVLSNDFDFTVFVLFSGGIASCWKYGQKHWSPMNTMGHRISDMVVSNGKCYAISVEGVLLYVDSSLKPAEMIVLNLPLGSFGVYFLLEYKSDLYVLLKNIEVMIGFDDERDSKGIPSLIPFSSWMFKRCNRHWEKVRCMTDEAVISFDDASIILPVEDYKFSNGNCVHVATTSSVTSHSGERLIYYGVYDLGKAEIAFMKRGEGSQIISWPPPSWLLAD